MAGLLNKLRMMDAAPAKAPAPQNEKSAETGLYRREAVFPLSTFCDRSYATPETLRTVFGCDFPASVVQRDAIRIVACRQRRGRQQRHHQRKGEEQAQQLMRFHFCFHKQFLLVSFRHFAG